MVKKIVISSLFTILTAVTIQPALAAIYIQSVDGLGLKNIHDLVAQNKLSQGLLLEQYEKLIEFEVKGTGNTGPSHSTIFSGTEPEVGGWIANSFVKFGDPLSKTSSAFNEVPSNIHLVTALKNRKKKVACLNVPTLNDNLQCDLQLSFNRRMSESCSASFNNAVEIKECLGDTFSSFEKENHSFQLHGKNVDLALNTVHNVCWSEGEKIRTRLLYLEELSSNNDKTKQLRLYASPTHELKANIEFKETAPHFLCWPGVLDPTSMRSSKLSPSGFFNILKFQHEYTVQLALHVLNTKKYDVVFNYTSILDSVQHEFFVSKHHSSYNEYSQFITKAVNTVSTDLKRIEKELTNDDSMVIFSDHGMVNAHTVFFINGLLSSSHTELRSSATEIRALTSGGLLHVYFSPFNQNKAIELREKLIQLEYRDLLVFDKVFLGEDMKFSQLNHPNSGQIVAVLNEGFSLDPRNPPTGRYFYPTVTIESDTDGDNLSRVEKDFLLKGTPNRVSPGVHGFQSRNINGFLLLKVNSKTEKERKTLLQTEFKNLILELAI